MAIRDGLGGEEVNQTVTTTAIVSGTNVYAKTAVTAPTIYGSTLVSGATLAGVAVTNTQGALKSNKQGAAFGATVQAGSGALGAGSNAWIVYNTAYTTNALPVATDTTTAAMALFIPAGSLGAGSFYIEGVTASDTFNWIAVGI